MQDTNQGFAGLQSNNSTNNTNPSNTSTQPADISPTGDPQQTNPPLDTSIPPVDQQNVPVQSGGMENYLANQKTPNTNVVVPSGLGKRSVKGKLIATILGIILLVGGVSAGVYLVGQQQEFRERAAGTSICEQSPDCYVIENPGNTGSYQVTGIVYNVYLTTDQVNAFDPTVKDDGCYRVDIGDDQVSWEKYGTDPTCEDLVNIQVWTLGGIDGTQSPSVSAQCLNIKIYDTKWNQLSSQDMQNLSSSDVIRIAVDGSTNQGSIDMARFVINGEVLDPVTTKRPGTNEYYEEYTIPSDAADLTINAQLHHSEAGWF